MKRTLFLLIAVSTISTGILCAQEAERGPDGGTTTRVSGVEVLPALSRPFSATSHTNWTRILEDGSTVKTHLQADIARDSQGRIYRERRTFAADGSEETSRLFAFYILDPVRHTHTECVVATHRCNVTPYFSSATFTAMPAGPFNEGKRFLARESLGTNILNGFEVTGTRETTTINAGVLGNDRPLITTREFWYSPDLQVNLSVTRKDPREGTQLIQLDNLSRSEPPPERFQIPGGYTIENAHQSQQASK